MTFEEVYQALELLGVKVEWIDAITFTEFSAEINCKDVIVKEYMNTSGELEYSTLGEYSASPTIFSTAEGLFIALSKEHLNYNGTTFTNTSDFTGINVKSDFSDIAVGTYFYSGTLMLKVSDESAFPLGGEDVIFIKPSTKVDLCIANVEHKPFTIPNP